MTEIPRETLHEILRKLTPCFEERVNAIKAFMDTPTYSIQQVILVEDAVAEMKAILFDANIVEAVVRMACSCGSGVDGEHRFFSSVVNGIEVRVGLFDLPDAPSIGIVCGDKADVAIDDEESAVTFIPITHIPALVEEAWQV